MILNTIKFIMIILANITLTLSFQCGNKSCKVKIDKKIDKFWRVFNRVYGDSLSNSKKIPVFIIDKKNKDLSPNEVICNVKKFKIENTQICIEKSHYYENMFNDRESFGCRWYSIESIGKDIQFLFFISQNHGISFPLNTYAYSVDGQIYRRIDEGEWSIVN